MKRGDFKEGVIFTFSTKDKSSTEKVKFHYSLKGRNGTKGFLDDVNGKHLGSAVIIIPKKNEGIAEQFFLEWKIPFEKQKVRLQDE